MESEDQVSALGKLLSENEGIELEIRSTASLLSEQNDPGSAIKPLDEIKYASDEVICMIENNKNISLTESRNLIAELKSEEVDESNVSVEKEELSQSVESRKNSVDKEKLDTILFEVGDASGEKDLTQTISFEALSEGDKLEITSNESRSSNNPSTSKVLPEESLESLRKQESPSNVFLNRLPSDVIREAKETQNVFESKSAENYASNTSTNRVLLVESLRNLCMREKGNEISNFEVEDSLNKKREINNTGESISPGKQQSSTRASETTEDKSITLKKLADDVESTVLINTSNVSAEVTANIDSEKNIPRAQNKTATETACEENIVCKEGATENIGIKNVSDKHSVDTTETVEGKNVTEEDCNIADKIEILHLKKDENVANEQGTTSKIAEAESNEAGDVGTSEVETHPGETEDGRERAAFFYISSSSIPGMGGEWEWPSVSGEYHSQRPSRRMENRRNKADSRNCLGTQRCHYIILAVGVLGAILGCLTYHLQDYGIGPKVLRPIGASAAFLSFVVCAFSSVYLTYLSYYTHGQSSRVTDPAASILINTMPQGYNSDPTFYFTSSAAATAQQVFRETQSADAVDRRGYSWYQSEIKRPFKDPGLSGYDPESKRIKMDPMTSEGEVYEMKSMKRISEKDGCKERNPSLASDSSDYTFAEQDYPSISSREREYTENTPLLPKK